MKVTVEKWKISKLIKNRNTINEQPIYQRKEVWNNKKKRFLIDSILRGIDIPKFYFRKMNGGLFNFEVADGQQRLNAIWKFVDDDLILIPTELNGFNLSEIKGIPIKGLKYSKLPEIPVNLKKDFDDYMLTISIIEESTNEEIRSLFGRLQMGNTLVPSEIRNAIHSKIGIQIHNLSLNHSFFSNCKIPPNRYKHHDYLAHVIALMHYKNSDDLKAGLLLKLYNEFIKKQPPEYDKQCADILDLMLEIDKYSNKRIVNKWTFVDIFYFLFLNHGKKINLKFFASKYDEFEKLRLKHYSKPEELLEGTEITAFDKDLYNYILAFKYEGSSTDNISKRSKVFINFFRDCIIN